MIDLEILEDKYIELLLKKCINFNHSKSLFINYDKVNKRFVEKVIARAREMGVVDICTDEEDVFELRDKLMKTPLDDIESDEYFNKSKWDEYALKGASFLMLQTEFPHVLDDVDSRKIAKAEYTNRSTRPIFREREHTYQIPWCIANLPNEIWAKEIFPEDEDPYKTLYMTILKYCMVDTEDPIKSWNQYLEEQALIQEQLTNLKIRKMHYTNDLGTDLIIELPVDCVWNSAASKREKNMFVNMPSFEVFTSPDFRKTNGIVYNAKPLVYSGGLVDDFFLEFKDGKVVNYGAGKGKIILDEIFANDAKALYLGEVALVDRDTPICQSNLVLGNTLFDENQSPHFALGAAFQNSIRNSHLYSDQELIQMGLNLGGATHVDFMVGTPDLNVLADTDKGPILIFKNGRFNL